MRQQNLLESLENRQLFAAPAIVLGPNNLYFNAVKGTSNTYLLRVQNTGDARLLLTDTAFRVRDTVDGSGDAKNFKILDFPAGGRSIGPGATVNFTVQFTARSGDAAGDIKEARLRVQSNATKNPRYLPLRGLVTAGEGGSLEPSLQKVFDLYKLPIKSGSTTPDSYKFTPGGPTDEVAAETFVKAGGGNVTVTPLALFTNKSTPGVRMGFYTPGDRDSAKYLWYVPGETSQSVNPFYYGTTGFDPGTAEFGLLTQFPNFGNIDGTLRNVYSEKALNKTWDTSSFNKFRVYPFINQAGQRVENAYIVAQEEYTKDYDNQDNVFLVTNVKPAGSTPTLSVTNDLSYPDDSTLLFNKVQNRKSPREDNILTRTSNSVTVRNTGSSVLTINSSVTGDYSIASGGGSKSINPGDTAKITLNFTATSGTSVHNGTLTITSNDPLNPTKAIALRGLWQVYAEQLPPEVNAGQPNTEPSAQSLVTDYLGYKTVITGNGGSLNNGGRFNTEIGDEVEAEYFTQADTKAEVTITELATFHNTTYVTGTDANGDPTGYALTNRFMGWYPKGNTGGGNHSLITDKQGTGQMLLPTPSSTSPDGTIGGNIGRSLTSGRFNPQGASFGFVVENKSGTGTSTGEWSEYDLNQYTGTGTEPSNFGKFLRFFKAYDGEGKRIPNAYIMLHDYNRPEITNYDFNDNIYLIRNVLPEGAVKTPVTAYAARSGGNVRLTWSSPTDGPKLKGFNVYRSTDPRGTYTILNSVLLNARPGNTFVDGNAAAGTTYYYAIASVANQGSRESDRVVVRA